MSKVFVAGHPALDFVGTLAERGHARIEELPTPGDLAQWFADAGLVDEPPPVSAAQLAAAIELREAIYRSVAALIDDRPCRESDRRLINRTASRRGPVLSLDDEDRRRRTGSAGDCLAALAAATIELYDRDDGARVRWCADERCTHPFLDRSRNKQRRWCDMSTCGDRAKVRAYRTRLATTRPREEVSPASRSRSR